MKPFPNKVNIRLLIIAIGSLAYFLIALYTFLSGAAIISGPIYPLYITIGILTLVIVSLVVLIIWRTRRNNRLSEIRA
jgi:membrane protein implicated in regulation of membrane protease activity